MLFLWPFGDDFMDTLKGKQIIVRITYNPSSFNGEGLFFCPFLNSSLDIVAKSSYMMEKMALFIQMVKSI